MTPGELKFALLLENYLNSLPDPEYRQLVVECLMVVGLVAKSSPQPTFGGALVVEHIIDHAKHLFLQDQVGMVWVWLGLSVVCISPDHLFRSSLRNCTRGPLWSAAVTTPEAVGGRLASVCTSMTVLQVVAMAP